MLIFVILFTIISSIKTIEEEPCQTTFCTENKDCQHYGYCNRTKNVCCLGAYGTCTNPGSRPVRPQIECETDNDCGYTYCDQQLKVCCSEGESPDSHCNGGLTYYGIEPECVEGSCQEDAECFKGHCCPLHKVFDLTVELRALPYSLNVRCRNNETPPFRNTFCRRDTERLAILGETRVNGTKNVETERFCVSNLDCSLDSVCVFSTTIGRCLLDPFQEPRSEFDFLMDPIFITLYSVVAVSFLSVLIMKAIHKVKKNDYYDGTFSTDHNLDCKFRYPY
ncbi:hypothetical protein CAEBREN_18720 [Caenorhabditis brenneri]|uniref:Domain of unknown function DX domain-containing protein n=1 Tax=Caenorhabditis brenneri TaxID=135651 RepID=G0NSK1_CAEBE|nr:hypothetical protein CAEBREN_18720 [Caenorhabditis brenneri]